MKRFIATSILLGYVMLVPFCFFGGMLMANAGAMYMEGNMAHQMDDCGMPLGGCAHTAGTGGIDTASHHVGMYNSITQTPLTVLLFIMLMATVFTLLVLGVSSEWLRSFLQQGSLRLLTRREEEPRNKTKQRTLHWLSLFESSPNFA